MSADFGPRVPLEGVKGLLVVSYILLQEVFSLSTFLAKRKLCWLCVIVTTLATQDVSGPSC